MPYNFTTLHGQQGSKELQRQILALVGLLSVAFVGYFLLSGKADAPVPEETIGGVEINLGDQVIAGQEILSAKEIEEARILFLIEAELCPAIREFNQIAMEMDELRKQGRGDSPELNQKSLRFNKISQALDGLLAYLGFLEGEFFSRYPEEKGNPKSPLNEGKFQAAT